MTKETAREAFYAALDRLVDDVLHSPRYAAATAPPDTGDVHLLGGSPSVQSCTDPFYPATITYGPELRVVEVHFCPRCGALRERRRSDRSEPFWQVPGEVADGR